MNSRTKMNENEEQKMKTKKIPSNEHELNILMCTECDVWVLDFWIGCVSLGQLLMHNR